MAYGLRCYYKGIFKDGTGRIVPSGTVTVYLAGTDTLASIYTTVTGTSAVNSVTANSTDGSFEFWIDRFDYNSSKKFKIVLSKSGYTSQTINNINIDSVVLGTYTLTSNTTVSTHIDIPEGIIFDGSVTLTFNGSTNIGFYKVFGNSITVLFGAGSIKEVYPDWWGGSESVSPYDTAAVQAAFDSGQSVKFIRNYYVTSVAINNRARQTIDFNGYMLIAVSTSSPNYVLAITGQFLSLYGIDINVNFLTYGCAIRWHSLTSNLPAEFNNVYGMRICFSTYGLIYGDQIGGSPVDAPQSENFIYNFQSYGVQVPYIGNQPNGFLTMINPLLNCHPMEWAEQPGYGNGVDWNTAAHTFNNANGYLGIIGGEVLKTSAPQGYGFKGKDFQIIGATLEINSIQGYITGSAKILYNVGGYQGGIGNHLFVIDKDATGVLTIHNGQFVRDAEVGGNPASEHVMITTSDLSDLNAVYTVDIWNGIFTEWAVTTTTLRQLISYVNFRVSNAVFSGVGIYNGKISGSIWPTWTPVITAETGTFTTVSATGYWTQIESIIHFQIAITITNKGTAAGGILTTLPITAARDGWVAVGIEAGTTGKMVWGYGSTTTMNIKFYDATSCIANGYIVDLSGTYEGANNA